MSSFKDLALNINILNALEHKGYSTPTPIQAQAIPHILLGKDFLGIAQTGTGKTAAFSLPILHLLSANKKNGNKNPRALILTPTRELASQIVDNVEFYGKELNLSYAVIFGGVSDTEQIKIIKKGVDIVVATPGRLIDLMQQKAINLQEIEIFVLDEADRMLDMGFIVDVKRIVKHLPKVRQNLFFSATMPQIINKLSHEILNQPVIAEITPQATTVERIDQKVFLIEGSYKKVLLKEILLENDLKTVLVFCKTKRGANQLATFLASNKINASLIHGNKSQNAREKALQDFRDGNVKVLIATDIASRGIDIVGISHVINFDMPLDPESYVHRIGRTARAGREGIAISFCDTLELKFLREVEKTIGKKLPIDDSRMFKDINSVSRKIGDNKNNNKNNNKQQEQIMTNNNNGKANNNQQFVGRKISSAKSHPKSPNDFITPEKSVNQGNKKLENKISIEEIQDDGKHLNEGVSGVDILPNEEQNDSRIESGREERRFSNNRPRRENNAEFNSSRPKDSRETTRDSVRDTARDTDFEPRNRRPHHENRDRKPNDRHKNDKKTNEQKESLVGNFFNKIKKILKVDKSDESRKSGHENNGEKRNFSEKRNHDRNRNPNANNSSNNRRQSSRSKNNRQHRSFKG